jgi:hypothetical protein
MALQIENTPMRFATKFGVSFAATILPEPHADELRHPSGHRRIGEAARDDLHEPHVAGWVEEVGDEQPRAQRLRQRLGERVHRETARVGGEHRAGREVRGDAREEVLLHRQALDDDLDHPVAIAEAREVVLQVPDLDSAGVRRQVERRGLHLFERRAPGGREPIADRAIAEGEAGGALLRARLLRHDVEEEHAQARVGEVGGDRRPHHPRPEHRHLVDPVHGRSPVRSCLERLQQPHRAGAAHRARGNQAR